jgi:hypothetical protein
MNTALAVLALLVALAALAVAVQARREAQGRAGALEGSDLPEDARGLRHEVAALRGEAATALKHLAVVRYDAFGAGLDRSSGGQLSWSLALLDDHGDGAVLTSIHGRNEARAYAKSITGWTCDQPLSPEEQEAVAHARRP